jgi:HSP20 family protein
MEMDRKFALVPGELGRLAREVDTFFGGGLSWFDWPVYIWGRPLTIEPEYLAPTEVFDRDGETVVKMELPGMEMNDIDISVADGVLTVKGEKKHEEETKEKDYYLSERTYGAFSRSIAVPKDLEASDIGATYHNGVLEISLPKPAEKKAKKVEVKAKS